MAPAQRIIYWQTSLVLGTAALIPCILLLFGEVFGQAVSDQSALVSSGFVEWALRFTSMLIGGLSVVLPSWAYLAATTGEHRGERLLLFAWVKIVGTIALLAIGMIVVPRPEWLLGGLAVAYLGHALAALFQKDGQQEEPRGS
jgi:hypothetical protein